MSHLNLLTTHGLTLVCLAEKPGATTREIAADLGMSERSIQKVVSALDSADYIRKEKVGRQNRYAVNQDKALHHPTKKDKTVGNLLAELINH